MEIRLHSSEYCVHEPQVRKGLSWNYIVAAVGLTFVTATALVAKPPAEPSEVKTSVPSDYVSLYSPKSEATPTLHVYDTPVAMAPAYTVVPSPKPSSSGLISMAALRPQARVAVPSPREAKNLHAASSCGSPCETGASTATPQPMPADSAMSYDASFASQDYDDTAHRVGPLDVATSVFGKVVRAPLTVLALSRDAVVDVANGPE